MLPREAQAQRVHAGETNNPICTECCSLVDGITIQAAFLENPGLDSEADE
jgi:hypothetical protein